MPLKPDALLAWSFEPVEQRLTDEGCILYALAVGLGRDAHWHRHVAGTGVVPFPTMATTLCRAGPWGRWPGTGITPERAVHVGQTLRIHRALATDRTIVAETRILGIEDLGAAKGALIQQERRLFERESGDLVATLVWTVLARADGGFGGTRGERAVTATPAEDDPAIELPVPVDAALLYRLTGDANPIHTDPAAARAAGFPRPLLHGLCIYGMAAAALLRARDLNAEVLLSLDARFAGPTYPGETVTLRHGADGAFAATAGAGPVLAGTLGLRA